MDHEWECVVVGGGAAGLSAALVLARARRRTLLIDAGEPSNGVAPAIGGLLGHDRRPPHELYAQGRRELAAYPTFTFREGCVVRGAPADGGSVLDLDDGSQVTAKRVLLATGMQYCPPSLPGMDKFWGTTVFQCPFCHAWELRDQRLATLAAGAEGVNTALMLRGWSDDVVLLTDGPSDLSSGDRENDRFSNGYVDLGEPGTPARDAATPKYISDTLAIRGAMAVHSARSASVVSEGVAVAG